MASIVKVNSAIDVSAIKAGNDRDGNTIVAVPPNGNVIYPSATAMRMTCILCSTHGEMVLTATTVSS